MNGIWKCSEEEGSCVFTQRKNEYLVVIRREPLNKKSFTWINIFRSDMNLNENEFLFWCYLDEDIFILMDEYRYGIGQIRSYFHESTENGKIIELFNKTRRGITESFGRQIRRFKKIMPNNS